jgi:Lon protease-like protein
MPLFPLNTVLFPGMVLPLHIFEPRYKLMIGQCIADNTPFGVVLIRSGEEVGGPAVPHTVGTSAYVRKVDQLSDGRMNIECVGYQRFKIHEILSNTPYMVGQIELIPPVEEDTPDIPGLAKTLRDLLDGYLSLISRATGKTLPTDTIPAQSDALAYWMAIVAPLEKDEKQALLECIHLSDLLKAEIALARKETMLLKALLFTESHSHTDTSGFSSN